MLSGDLSEDTSAQPVPLQTLAPSPGPLTRPSVAVLLAHIGSLLQQNPGAVQVAQRDGQVERSPTTRVQRLQVGLKERGRETEKKDRG